jgi:histidinol-phosphate aminotransferase
MINASDLVREEVLRLAPYNSGLTLREVNERYAPAKIAKLGSNESPLGPSPDLGSIIAGPDLIRLYPDPAGVELRKVIAVALASPWPKSFSATARKNSSRLSAVRSSARRIG